jgi:GntR family transcriptional repressor for pyruvate dehydrogenase complex
MDAPKSERQKTNAVKAINTENVTDVVFNKILLHIHNHNLKPGDKIPSEGALSKEFGFGRGSVREAVKALAQLGILAVFNGRTPEVAPINGHNIAILIEHAVRTSQVTIIQTWDLRNTLETRIAKLAALRRTDEQVDRMRTLCLKMKEAKDDFDLLTNLDIKLHLTWAEAAHNPLFLLNIQSLETIMAWTGPVGWRALGNSENLDDHIIIHCLITEAIAERRVDDAVELMRRHFNKARECLLDSGLG